MDYLSKVVELSNDPRIELGTEIRELLHKELCFGMTRYVCRNGTLSDGHEKITDAQRYYQAIREVFTRVQSIKSFKASALEAHADLLDASEMPDSTQAQKLRKEAATIKATARLEDCLLQSEDTMRQLDEFNKVRLELKDQIRSQFPGGIEQSEPSSWESVARYRHLKKQMGYSENLTHVPLDKEAKTNLGLELQSPDLMAWAIASDRKLLAELAAQHEALEKLEGSSHGEQGLLA